MGGTRNARLLRRTLVVAVVAAFGLSAAAPMAAADSCPVLDPGCVLDPGATAGGVVEDTTTTVGEVVVDSTTTVGTAVQDTTTTVGGMLEGDGPPNPGPIVDGVVPGGILPGSGSVPPGDGDTTSGGGGSAPGGGTHAGPPASGTHIGPAVRDPAGILISAPTGVASTSVSHPFPASLDDASDAVLSGGQIVRTLAFPLLLILLAVGFASVQNRIDRKDPKLALAPVGSVYLTFS